MIINFMCQEHVTHWEYLLGPTKLCEMCVSECVFVGGGGGGGGGC